MTRRPARNRSPSSVFSPPIRAFQWDLARQVERLDGLLGLLPKYAEWGYEELYLHLEDAVEFPSLPEIARADAYRYAEMERLVAQAARVGIRVVPIINLLGHTQYLIKTPGLRELNELRSDDGHPLAQGQLCPLHPRTAEVAAKLIEDVRPFCTAGKIHVGLDESFQLGKCPRCRAEVAAHGLAYHFSGYIKRLHRIATDRGLRLGFWADMLNFIPEAIPHLPTDVIAYDWYYYPFPRHPRVELFNFAESDLATPLQARGIEYWGCPMNGAFRYEPLPLFRDRLENLRSWWKRCTERRAGGFLITSWEAYRLALPLTTVTDAAAACLWKNPELKRDEALLREGFRRVFGGKTAATAARISLQADQCPFSGYAKWESNERWDLRAGLSGLESHKELRFLEKLFARTTRLPAPLRSSLGFRVYLAKRENFIRESAKGIFRLRRMLQENRETRAQRLLKQLAAKASAFGQAHQQGRRWANAMWTLTRDRAWPSQNERTLQQDRERLDQWRKWLRKALRNPRLAHGATLFCGIWQLTFKVHNFRPALQKIAVQQQQPDGKWKEIHGRYTIAFQAKAARPQSTEIDDFSAPVHDVNQALRLVLSGLGPLKISDVVLTNGVESHPLTRGSFRLGKAAPKTGFPDIFTVQGTRLLRTSNLEMGAKHG